MTLNLEKLGWPMAAVLAAVMGASALAGFQATPAPKFATVDTGKVFDGSSLAVSNNETLDTAKRSRLGVLDFVSRNSVMETADVRKLAELSVKEKPSDADKKEIDRLRAAGEAATQARLALSTKANPTDADKTAIAEYGNKSNANRMLLQTLQAQYQGEMETMATDLRDKTLSRVREVVKSIAAKQGYTVVFDANMAPYAANDLTEEALKALKK